MPAPQRPGFGRLISLDVRDRNYPMKALTRRITLPESRLWSSRKAFVLDQGSEPACVGFAWTAFLQAAPWMHSLGNDFALELYHQAQENDEWAGTNYEGSSTRGGAKALAARGLITGAYVWAANEADVWRFVLGVGPVVTGTTWLTGMFNPDSKGYLRLTGGEEGGHDWCIIGADAKRQAYRMVNSWSSNWGQSGRAWIRREDYRALLEDLGGDCASAVEVQAA